MKYTVVLPHHKNHLVHHGNCGKLHGKLFIPWYYHTQKTTRYTMVNSTMVHHMVEIYYGITMVNSTMVFRGGTFTTMVFSTMVYNTMVLLLNPKR